MESTFSPFWRSDPNASGHHGNAGIGLALVRRIMETVGGAAIASQEGGMVIYSLHFPVQAAGDAGLRNLGEVSVVPAGKL